MYKTGIGNGAQEIINPKPAAKRVSNNHSRYYNTTTNRSSTVVDDQLALIVKALLGC